MCMGKRWNDAIGKASTIVFSDKDLPECGCQHLRTPFALIKIIAMILCIVAAGMALYGDHYFVFTPMIIFQCVYLFIILACLVDLLLRTCEAISVENEVACKIDVTLCVIYLFIGLVSASILIGTIIEPYLKVVSIASSNIPIQYEKNIPPSNQNENSWHASTESEDDIEVANNPKVTPRVLYVKGSTYPWLVNRFYEPAKAYRVNEDIFMNRHHFGNPITTYDDPLDLRTSNHRDNIFLERLKKFEKIDMTKPSPNLQKVGLFEITKIMPTYLIERKNQKNFRFHSDVERFINEEKSNVFIKEESTPERRYNYLDIGTDSWKPQPLETIIQIPYIRETTPSESIENFAPAANRFLKKTKGNVDSNVIVILIGSIVAALVSMLCFAIIIIIRMWVMF